MECQIENTLKALQERIDEKKEQMHHKQAQMASAPVFSNMFSEILNKADGPYTQILGALGPGREFAQHFVQNLQQDIQEKPWDVLRKAAIGSFTVGLMLSHRRRKSSTRENG